MQHSKIGRPMSAGGQNEKPPFSGLCQLLPPAPDIGLPMLPPPCADFVAKVFLHRWPKILRAVDATFVLRCGGPHRRTVNSRATSVTRLRLHEKATVDPIDFWRENCHRAISDFCNKIGTQRSAGMSAIMESSWGVSGLNAVEARDKVDARRPLSHLPPIWFTLG